MAAEREQSSAKLIYLRDHAPRRSRADRRDRKARRDDRPPAGELAAEGIWLGRALLVIAAGILIYWAGIYGGATRPESSEAWRWAVSHSLPHLFLAISAAYCARCLLRQELDGPLPIGLVAGALVVLALEGITRAMTGEQLEDLSIGVRANVLVQTASLAIGVWAASFALRCATRPTDTTR